MLYTPIFGYSTFYLWWYMLVIKVNIIYSIHFFLYCPFNIRPRGDQTAYIEDGEVNKALGKYPQRIFENRGTMIFELKYKYNVLVNLNIRTMIYSNS